jgi:hypothetical protein
MLVASVSNCCGSLIKLFHGELPFGGPAFAALLITVRGGCITQSRHIGHALSAGLCADPECKQPVIAHRALQQEGRAGLRTVLA